MSFFKQLFCKHKFGFPQFTGKSKLRLTEPWSSETGHEVRNQDFVTCSRCDKTKKYWKMTEKRGYGTIAVEKFRDVPTEGNEK